LPPARQPTGLHRRFEPDVDGAHLRPWVLLLDHDYTEHGLRWRLLKGEDRWRGDALRSAAETLGLRLHLALVELHEHWAIEPADEVRGRHGRWRDDEDDCADADGMGDDGAAEVPVELLDRSLVLDFWVDADDAVDSRRPLLIRDEDTACFVATGKAHLVNEEHEGYMGNYGNTVDYWYRRAALVIRTPLAQARDRFELDFDAALQGLREMAQDPGRMAQLALLVQLAATELAGQAGGPRQDAYLDAYAEIAAALPDDVAATALMRPCDPTRLQPQHAAALARLAHRRGNDWLRGLLRAWYDPGASHWGALRGWEPAWGMALDLPRLVPLAPGPPAGDAHGRKTPPACASTDRRSRRTAERRHAAAGLAAQAGGGQAGRPAGARAGAARGVGEGAGGGGRQQALNSQRRPRWWVCCALRPGIRNMSMTRLKLGNWRNFREVDVRLGARR
jgi:hypothetical protein